MILTAKSDKAALKQNKLLFKTYIFIKPPRIFNSIFKEKNVLLYVKMILNTIILQLQYIFSMNPDYVANYLNMQQKISTRLIADYHIQVLKLDKDEVENIMNKILSLTERN
jgi:hypothetical protein